MEKFEESVVSPFLERNPLVDTKVYLDPNDENLYINIHIFPSAVEHFVPWQALGLSDSNGDPPTLRLLERSVSDARVASTGLVSGLLLEAVATIALYPLDTVKTRLQTQGLGLAAGTEDDGSDFEDLEKLCQHFQDSTQSFGASRPPEAAQNASQDECRPGSQSRRRPPKSSSQIYFQTGKTK